MNPSLPGLAMGSLALDEHLMGFAIDRLDTDMGRFYIGGRWCDARGRVPTTGPALSQGA
ncbi:hypothetical protein D3C76_955440 [compost metagenome]